MTKTPTDSLGITRIALLALQSVRHMLFRKR